MTVKQLVMGKYGLLDEFYSYQGLIKSADLTILFQESIGSYQGDEFYILTDGKRFGYLQNGYGSCSGCDSFCACSSLKDYEDLRDELVRNVKWHDTKEELAAWLKEHDWKGDYCPEAETAFVPGALAALTNQPLG